MKKIIHKAADRGFANHGWLKSYHSFSFANYFDAQKINFGALRVLNDDLVASNMGFGKHPHKNMEIVSIPLSGTLYHEDDMGNSTTISEGEVQIMSAGTGIFHAEKNESNSESVAFLQIWILPEKIDIAPRYDQQKFDKAGMFNEFQTLVSPIGSTDEGVKINQNAWFSSVYIEKGKALNYELKDIENGIYVFVLEGEIDVDTEKLNKRDAIGLSELSEIGIKAYENAEVLIIEIPIKNI